MIMQVDEGGLSEDDDIDDRGPHNVPGPPYNIPPPPTLPGGGEPQSVMAAFPSSADIPGHSKFFNLIQVCYRLFVIFHNSPIYDEYHTQ